MAPPSAGDGYVDLSQQSISLDPSSFFQPMPNYVPQVSNSVTPYLVTADQITMPTFSASDISLPVIDLSTAIDTSYIPANTGGASYSPTYTARITRRRSPISRRRLSPTRRRRQRRRFRKMRIRRRLRPAGPIG